MHHTQLITCINFDLEKSVHTQDQFTWWLLARHAKSGFLDTEIFLILVGPPVPSSSPEHVTSPPAFDGIIMGRGSDGRWGGEGE